MLSGFLQKGPGKRRLLHLAILLSITMTLVGTRFIFADHYRKDRREVERQGRERRTAELLAFWAKLDFVQGGELPEAFTSHIDWRSLGLSDKQMQLAMARLKDVIAYLQNPSFEEYYRLKTEGLHYRFKITPRATHVLSGSRQPQLTNDCKQTVAAVWERMAAQSAPSITAICLDSIAAITTTTNTPATLLGGKLWKSFTIAYTALDPGFEYGASAATRLSSSQFLDLSFFARSSTSTNPAPVHLSLAWSQKDEAWALNQLLTDVHLNLNTMF